MKNAELESVYNNYETSFSEEPQYTIDFVKNNYTVLISSPIFYDIEEFKKYLAIIGRLIRNLVKLKEYTVAINEADQYLPFIEKMRTDFNMKASDDKWYLTLRFQKAMALFNLKKYKSALNQFLDLAIHNPENLELKKWIFYSKYGARRVFLNASLVIAAVLILSSIFFSSYFSHPIHLILSSVGLALVINYYLAEYKFKKALKQQA